MIRVTLVPQNHVLEVWPSVTFMIERALKYAGGRISLENVLADLLASDQTLWLALDDSKIIGCATVRINIYPTGMKALVYEHLGGEYVQRWLTEGHKVCSRYAREFGCTVLECQGRSGWKPFLEELGYTQLAVKYECKLED